MEVILLKITAILYLVAAVSYVFYVAFRNANSRIPAVALGAGFTVHSAALAAHFLREGYPAVTQLSDALSFKSWLMIAAYLVIQLKYSVNVLGCIVTPLAFLMSLAGFAFGSQGAEVPPALKTFWLPLHVTLASLGNAVFALAFAVSLMYLAQERRLKHKKVTALMKRLPSLESLDRLNSVLLFWGFPFMTLGIITGSIWAGIHWGDYWSWDPRQITSGLAWLFYGALLHGRVTAGLRGRKAALLTVFGFVVVLGYFLWGDALFPSRHGGRFD
ncbi:MAG TPA: cytochrome c biogenesis protein CcsA [candidate division Zixibacteria bacterium]|nr:cytochrome c biogenesis protein CcsA [candidate division Zixibacteria bacterium]